MDEARTPGRVLVVVDQLRRLSTGELRERYAEVFGEPTNSRNRSYLFRKIAAELRGADNDAVPGPEESLDSDQAPAAPRGPRMRPAGTRDPRLPPPGTVLERAHNGRVVRVIVLEAGFEYEGAAFRSLSAVARAATGTPWNGLLFFGLTACTPRLGRGRRRRS